MLDVHPPHAPTHTWKDFFLHIATICVGLLIAIGLEQSVEAIHHHHQREYLEQQMHEESQRSLDLLKPQLLFTTQSKQYASRCIQALQDAPVSGNIVTVRLPVNDTTVPAAGILISPSRGTWTVAIAAGTVALLPPETAKIYARLDLAESFEQASETTGGSSLSALESTELRAGVLGHSGSPVPITTAQREDLLFAFNQFEHAVADLQFRLAIVQGALQAIVDNVSSLDQMYPYQQRAVQSLPARQ